MEGLQPEHLEELRKAIEAANNGNWIPITIISFLFGILAVLIIHIYNQRFRGMEKVVDQLTTNQTSLTKSQNDISIVLARIENQIENQDERITENREDIKGRKGR